MLSGILAVFFSSFCCFPQELMIYFFRDKDDKKPCACYPFLNTQESSLRIVTGGHRVIISESFQHRRYLDFYADVFLPDVLRRGSAPAPQKGKRGTPEKIT